MSAPAITLAAVRKFSPCEVSYRRVASLLPKCGKIDAAQARAAGCTFDDIVWIASAVARKDAKTERLLRHWIADCAARALHIYERDYPGDDRPRNAIQAGRNFADGRIDVAAWAVARGAAWDAAGTAARAAAGAAARAAAWAAARDAARDAARAAARDAARDVAWAVAWAAAWAVAWDAERAWQFDRLIYWLTDDAPEPLGLPALTERLAA